VPGVRWILQSTYLGESPAQWAGALAELGVSDVVLLPISPDDRVLPALGAHYGPTVFFGSSLLKVLAAGSHHIPGVWFPAENFHARTLAARWGDRMLNSRHWIGPLAESLSAARTFDNGQGVFVRPAESLKLTKGAVLEIDELRAVISSAPPASAQRRFELAVTSEVLVAPAQLLRSEWRCFVARGRVVAASQYLLGGVLTITRPGVLLPDFEAMYADLLSGWTPAPLFSLDITERADGEYRIVEVNCFNSSGLYGCDPRVVFAAANDQAQHEWISRPGA
jgi:hypothetical protein